MAALLDLRMPGVYTQEVPTLPPSVGVIPSAVPVFIGYTEKAMRGTQDLKNKPTRIKSMQEYEEWFGGPQMAGTIKVGVDNRKATPQSPVVTIKDDDFNAPSFKMFYALQLYFNNGGGPCFIHSVGTYTTTNEGGETNPTTVDAAHFSQANVFKPLQKAKEVTILVFPDSETIGATSYKGIIELALQHCEKMKNRVTVIDVLDYSTDDTSKTVLENASDFQSDMPTDIDFKKYGMAYYPFLETSQSYAIDATNVSIDSYQSDNDTASAEATEGEGEGGEGEGDGDGDTSPWKDIRTKIKAVKEATDATAKTAAQTALKEAVKDAKGKSLAGAPLDVLEYVNNTLYSAILTAIRARKVVLPPSPAVAGIFVRTDATQGVWKAPANTSVFGIIQPTIELDDDDHAGLNAPDNGKAINAIRPYRGRGILLYGGRTLAGNDLEWRYVNVRRTFCFIEDSVERAMQDFVFSINTKETWIKVKAMIDSFLNQLWKAGGLYGQTPEDAYQVIVGEPDSMTVDDVLKGIMRVIIKVAVARPAEFIVLQYEHKFELTDG